MTYVQCKVVNTFVTFHRNFFTCHIYVFDVAWIWCMKAISGIFEWKISLYVHTCVAIRKQISVILNPPPHLKESRDILKHPVTAKKRPGLICHGKWSGHLCKGNWDSRESLEHKGNGITGNACPLLSRTVAARYTIFGHYRSQVAGSDRVAYPAELEDHSRRIFLSKMPPRG